MNPNNDIQAIRTKEKARDLIIYGTENPHYGRRGIQSFRGLPIAKIEDLVFEELVDLNQGFDDSNFKPQDLFDIALFWSREERFRKKIKISFDGYTTHYDDTSLADPNGIFRINCLIIDSIKSTEIIPYEFLTTFTEKIINLNISCYLNCSITSDRIILGVEY